MDRVSLFNPFRRPPDGHEDRLTWAFLIVLKYDLLMQRFLRELVESRLPSALRIDENTWEPARISTQTKWVGASPNVLVSVLVTDAREQEDNTHIMWSDREPRYDGVIEFPNDMTLIIEDKLFHGNVNEEQLNPSTHSFADDIKKVLLHDSAICLEWSEILEGVLEYINSPMPAFGDREIARDFLSFVEQTHPALTPYRTFTMCGDRTESLDRRTNGLVDEIADLLNVENRGGYLYRPDKIAQQIYFWVRIPDRNNKKSWRIRVALYPASTAWQADCFSENVQRSEFLSLEERGWNVKPNFNLAFPMGRKLLWITSPCGVPSYLDYFFSNERARPYGRKLADELPHCINEWLQHDIIDSQNREEIDRICERKSYLNVNPELMVYREWNRDTVIRLEEEETLAKNIMDALKIPLATWGEDL